ncbi:GNAT family N-acetyltransferase [Aneurinibacillus migulanus]|uniref:GNAT family N-acetyltransferase n=1 Tax=Aneurinibacillus migulanus TaxID=47500 RepID=UPI00209EE6E2|nr:GNAT family N-acetyltransferase [Aneurinibacillus migulanus]MCP1354872.1 GNAT family N-acetyltransferase [Aneurinibacillus migulanus]
MRNEMEDKGLERIDIRHLENRNELNEVYDVWTAAFPEELSFFVGRLKAEPEYDSQTTWIATVEGKVAAAVQIFPFCMWYKGIELAVGGIGNVATHPEYRGRGLTHRILLRQLGWMKEQEYDISFLFTGIPGFYEKMGWKIVREAEHTIRKEEGSRLKIEDEEWQVVPFSFDDIRAMRAIYETYSQQYAGARIRHEEYWRRGIGGQIEKALSCLIAKRNGRTVAYVLYSVENGAIFIQELCHSIDGKDAVSVLVQEIYARHPEAEKMKFKLPEGSDTFQQLKVFGARTSYKEEAMWRAVNHASLSQKLGGIEPYFTPENFLFWEADKF